MPHEFETRVEIALAAAPEEVWDAIATGPGLDAWFMGRNEVEPGEGGRMRMLLGGQAEEATVTAWDPPKRLAYRGQESPDGRFLAFEWLIEGRDGGSTVLRGVTSGMLGDDWEDEYEAMRRGWPMYLHKLAQYLRYFRGRTATPVSVYGPQAPDRDAAWAAIRRGLGLPGPVSVGDPVRLTPAGLPVLSGVVDYADPEFLGVRTADGLYRFIHGYEGSLVLGHHLFAPVDPAGTERAWRDWLTTVFADYQAAQSPR